MRLFISAVLVFWLCVTAAAQQKSGQVSFTAPKGWVSSSIQGGLQFTLKNAAGEPDRVIMVGQDMTAPADPAAWLNEKALSFLPGTPLRETPPESQKLPGGLMFTYKAVVGGTADNPVIYLVGLVHNSTSAVLLAGLTGDPGKAEALGNELEAMAKSAKFTGTPLTGAKTSGTAVSPSAGQTSTSGTTSLPEVKPMNAAQFKAAGGDPAQQLIPDEFRCYLKRKGDGLNPDMAVQVLPGGKYRTVYGGGAYQIDKDRKITWQGGPLDKADGYLNFDHDGQEFSLSDVGEDTLDRSLDFECYQRGPRENVALYNFKLRTPKPGTYSCLLADGKGNSTGKLEVGPNGTYSFGGVTGRYRVDYRSDQSSRRSEVTLQTGGDDEETGHYFENATGLRVFSLTVPTGGSLVSRRSTEWTCTAVAKPAPAPSRYGSEKAPAPPKGSGGLSGHFAHNRAGQLIPTLQLGPNFTTSMALNSECAGNVCWEFAFFNPNGYVYTEEPEVSASEADCTRTYPNGLPICQVYRINGKTIQIGSDKPVPFTLQGSVLTLDGWEYNKLQPLDNLTLNGNYESIEVTNGVYLGGSTSYQYLKFGAGRTFSLDSNSSTTVMVPGATASNSSRDTTLIGTYRFTGNTLEMTYRDGRVVRQFAVLPVEKGKLTPVMLRIGGTTYYQDDGKKK